jgi:hypothetical protein
MIMHCEEESTIPTAKDRKNKEQHDEKIFMFSIYIIIVVEGLRKEGME